MYIFSWTKIIFIVSATYSLYIYFWRRNNHECIKYILTIRTLSDRSDSLSKIRCVKPALKKCERYYDNPAHHSCKSSSFRPRVSKKRKYRWKALRGKSEKNEEVKRRVKSDDVAVKSKREEENEWEIERERERGRIGGMGGGGRKEKGAMKVQALKEGKREAKVKPPSRRRPWTTFLIATFSRTSPFSPLLSELFRMIRTKGKQFSVDAAADAYHYLSPSSPSNPILPATASPLPSLAPPRTTLSRRRGPTFAPYLFTDLSSPALHHRRGPPLFFVQQVARSFKTCRHSFVRFKKPKHRQSSALRRQDRYSPTAR